MEEILASIRRIIADDNSLPERPDIDADTGKDHAQEHRLPEVPPEPSAIHELHPLRPAESPASPSGTGEQAEATRRETDSAEAALAVARAHGTIAAPQYARPDGPQSNAATLPPPQNEADDFGSAPHEGSPHEGSRDEGSRDEGSPTSPVGDEAPTAQHHAAHAPAPDRAASQGPPPPHQASSIADHDLSSSSDEAVRPAGDSMASMISASARTSVVSAFNTLAAARLVDNSEELRSMAKTMLQPLLATWLEEHLPGLVERAVREEIERVARGGH